ncbi:MAG: hypothetical protein OXN89_01190 [Bryobacterales bacterium]|nr:hypothetical protein [Bryobacterales bacterium]
MPSVIPAAPRTGTRVSPASHRVCSIRSTYWVTSIQRSSAGKTASAAVAATGVLRRLAVAAARNSPPTRTMAAAAVPRNRGRTNVVSSAPRTLPAVEAAKIPPAFSEGSCAGAQAWASSTLSASSHPTGAIPTIE